MSEETLKQAGKEVVDVIQAFVDPEFSPDKMREIQEAARALWNLKDDFGDVPTKALVALVLLGAFQDIVGDYFSINVPSPS